MANGKVKLFFWIESQHFFNPLDDWPKHSSYSQNYLAYIAMLIPLFSALRLAKFNIDTRQSDSFIGLPTPANALFFISIPYIVEYGEGFMYDLIYRKEIIIICVITLSLLMISELRLITLKFKSTCWSENKYRYVLILSSVILLLLLRFEAIPIILILYIILSIINKQVK